MKILFDFKLFFEQKFGGPSKYYVELIKSLKKLNVDIEIFAPIYINNFLKNESSIRVNGIYLNEKKYFGKIFNFTNKILTKIKYKTSKSNIIHTTYYQEPYISNNKPYILTVYDLIHEKYNKDFNYILPKKKAIEKASHIICISENTKNDLEEYYKVNSEKISVIYLATTEKKIENRNRNNNLLFVGNRKRYKNFKMLLKVFRRKEIQNNFNIVCFGGGKFLNEELDYIKSLGISENKIQYLQGNDLELAEQYKTAFALIYPSLYEGFGLPILEAMSYGCPVISSNSSSLPEVYGDAALSFDPNNEEQLFEIINKLLKQSELRDDLIIKGFKNLKKFSWEKCAKETLDVYERVLNG